MSQLEFNAYLAQLTKSLRLRKARSADLADELSDHLDARLEELLAQGKTRDEAIRLALEEFGGAPDLAQKFSRLAKSRQRKFVMRCTAASSVVVAGVLLVAVSLMPIAPEGPGAPPAVAQEETQPEAIASSNPGEESVEQQAIAALDRKLSQAVKVDFSGVPLREVIGKLAEQIKADVIFDEQAIEEEGLTIDNTPTLKFEHAQVTARTAFEFLVEPEGLAVANRSGVLFVTSMSRAEELLVIKVYNVRDLIEQAAPSYATPPLGGGMGGMGGGMGGGFGGGMGGLGGGMGGGGLFSIQDHIATAIIAGQMAQFDPAEDENAGAMGGGMSGIGMGGMGGGMGGMGGATGRRELPVADSPEQRAALALAQLIQELTGGPWFEIDGQGGSVRSFHGLLVVRQTEETHNEIRKLLDGLREANQSGPGSSVTVPKGDAPVEEQTESGPGLRDLSVLGEFDLTNRARIVLLAMEPGSSGVISQLDALRAVSLTTIPSQPSPGVMIASTLARDVVEPTGVSDEAWRSAIVKGQSRDQPLGDLKTLLDAAKKHARDRSLGDQPIAAEHLLLALLDYKDGPIPAVLAHVGLTPEGLRQKVLSLIEGPVPNSNGFQRPEEELLTPEGLRSESEPLDLSVLEDYEVTPDARAALAEISPDASGEISQLEALRAITLTDAPSLSNGKSPRTFANYVIEPQFEVDWTKWQTTINQAAPYDKPLGDLKILLDRAKKIAGEQPIDAEHLFLALVEYQDGPIPGVLTNVGLTAERLRDHAAEFWRRSEKSDDQDAFIENGPVYE